MCRLHLKRLTQSFNPRVREGRDAAAQRQLVGLRVSTRASARDATSLPKMLSNRKKSFNPRVREGRDEVRRMVEFKRDVSTRASARDATKYRIYWDGPPKVSTRASARDATKLTDERKTEIAFQPARPRGTRRSHVAEAVWAVWFQPARPRGTRRFRALQRMRLRGFNPRVREGRDAPVPPCGRASRSFNPRVREGRDPHASKLVVALNVSTRASARDATPSTMPPYSVPGCFNPRVREGRDGPATWE